MVSFNTKSYSKKLLLLIGWSHWFTFFNIIAAIGISSYYLFSDGAPETIIGQAYLVTTWLSHIAFLTFISFVLILFPITIIFPNTKFIRTISSIIFSMMLLLLVLDAFIYSRLGYHLAASSSDQIITLVRQVIEDEGVMFYVIGALSALFIITYEFVVSNYAWKHLRQLQKTIFARFVVFGLILSFFISHLTHIWADANLEYDVLRQDTLFPFSYPATAKTLLTKYDLFNKEDYIARKNSPLSFSNSVGDYPILNVAQCNAEQAQSVFIVLTDLQLSEQQFYQLKRRAQSSKMLHHNTDASLTQDAWFNLFYSLPNIYQQDILSQNVKPLLFQAIESKGLATSFTLVSSDKNASGSVVNESAKAEDNTSNTDTDISATSLTWFEQLFDERKELGDISSLVFANKLNSKEPGLHLIYFRGLKESQLEKDSNQTNAQKSNTLYQFELFVDALLLAQQQKQTKDIIWISSIGNLDNTTRLSNKHALLVMPNKKVNAEIEQLTSLMDVQPTLMKHWLACNDTKFSNGSDIMSLNKNRVLANTVPDGMIVFDKDKSVLVDQNGNFHSYSSQLDAPITITSDFPLMIDGVHFINKFRETKRLEKVITK